MALLPLLVLMSACTTTTWTEVTVHDASVHAVIRSQDGEEPPPPPDGSIIIRNAASAAQTMLIVELTDHTSAGGAAVPLDPGNLPVLDGRVRFFTYMDEPVLRFWIATTTGTPQSWARAIERGEEPPERPFDLGLALAPGETTTMAGPRTSGATIVIVNDAIGAYEAGAFASVRLPELRTPTPTAAPVENTRWPSVTIILLAVWIAAVIIMAPVWYGFLRNWSGRNAAKHQP